jgi:serine/threonine-protein kinase
MSFPTHAKRASGRVHVRGPLPLIPGAIVGRGFCVHHKIATGGMGEVWAGEHVELRLRVALKVLLKDALVNQEVVARFSREAFLLGQIHSEHVVRVLDFSTGRFGPVLVMEYVEGPGLGAVIQSRRFAVEEAIELGMDIANALREVHAANVVHRDVKPANLILRPLRDGTHRAVFVDLGVSRLVPEGRTDAEALTEITSDDRALGTVEYMAPEQILSSRSVTPAADVYSLGAILFRAVAGQNVFGDVRAMDLMRLKLSSDSPALETGRTDRVAEGFESLVAKALARSPEDRYETADEILADLSLLRDTARRVGREPKVRSIPPPLPSPRASRSFAWPSWARQRRRWVAASAAVAVTFALVAIGLHARATPPKTSTNIEAELAAGHCTILSGRVEDAPASGPRKLALKIACDEVAARGE